MTTRNRFLSLFFAASILLLPACSYFGGDNGDGQMMADSGQCWSQKGGVGNLIKNSSTKSECKELGGKSWCPTGGGCEDL